MKAKWTPTIFPIPPQDGASVRTIQCPPQQRSGCMMIAEAFVSVNQAWYDDTGHFQINENWARSLSLTWRGCSGSVSSEAWCNVNSVLDISHSLWGRVFEYKLLHVSLQEMFLFHTQSCCKAVLKTQCCWRLPVRKTCSRFWLAMENISGRKEE